MDIQWSEAKNELLKKNRNISFEQVKTEIEAHRNTEPEVNPAHEKQFITIVKLDGYPVVVPFILEDNGNWFLKTAYKCRKAKGRI